ncbi:MAG: Chagasin family peptidase inhibitor [Humisphaera sp.]|nr:Chagasin family peptidase inhibitor [Humisphaera sp.]
MRLHRRCVPIRLIATVMLLLSVVALPGCLNNEKKTWYPGPSGGGGGPGSGGGGGEGPDVPDSSATVITLVAGNGTNELRQSTLRPGQTLKLRLVTKQASPLLWRLSPESATALKSGTSPVRVAPRKIEQSTGADGNLIYHSFSISTLRPGRLNIRFLYDRVTDPNTPPAKTFTLDVAVAQ